MKVGILTFHRAENYGALLQAYALFTYLRNMGHDVEFIDYWPQYHSDFYNLFSANVLKKLNYKGKIYYILMNLLWLLPRLVRKRKLQFFMHKHLGLSNSPMYTNNSCISNKYDIAIYGSDQIWRKQHLGGIDFDSWYFGSENVSADKKIVYAGSMGIIETKEADDEFLKNMMMHFQHISVREDDLQQYLSSLNIKSVLVNDPVFLLSKEQWRSIEEKPKQNGKYILFYNLLLTSESKKFAEILSKETNLPIREINLKRSFHNLGSRYVRTASIEQFLGLIDYAEFVVSNSFHGVAFSLIYEKQFFAVGMARRANRVVSLLNSIGIPERYSDSGRGLLALPSIDYYKTRERVNNFVEHSTGYLESTVNYE